MNTNEYVIDYIIINVLKPIRGKSINEGNDQQTQQSLTKKK
jgi:hypothetical protein